MRVAGRDVRRRRLRGRRRARGRRRPRRHRGAPRARPATRERCRTGARGCCTIEDARDARRAADVLGHPVLRLGPRRASSSDDVVDDFVAEYAAGRTPNPCLRCNERIKFAAVLDRALALGFDAVCTGHYAPARGRPGRPSSCTARSTRPRTSRTCSACSPPSSSPTRCSRSGDSPKAEVRAEAAARGLLVADKPDSHDICFIPDGDTARLPRPSARAPAAGDIVDDRRRGGRRARGRLRVHRRPAARAAPRPSPRPTAAPVRAVDRAGRPTRSPSVPRRRSRSTTIRAARRAGAARLLAPGRRARAVRAHGEAVRPAPVSRRGGRRPSALPSR